MVNLTIEVNTDYNKDATFDHTLDNITAKVISARWSNGMDSPRGFIAPIARATFIMDNTAGDFNADPVSGNVIQNGNLTAWTAGVPDNWSIVGTPAVGTREITQVGATETYGGTGTGAANFYRSGGTNVRLRQTITTGKVYKVSFVITAIGSDNVGGIVIYNNAAIISPIYQTTGKKSLIFLAGNTALDIAFQASINTNITVDDIELYEMPSYSWLQPGGLIRIISRDNYGIGLLTQFWLGRIEKIETKRDYNAQGIEGFSAVISAVCFASDLMRGEYNAPLLFDARVDEMLTRMFDDSISIYPYEGNFWNVNTEGASALGYTTTLAPDSSAYRAFDVGSSTFAYLGDTSARGKGTTPYALIQDLMAGELGGRFFWDCRSAYWLFQSRNNDALDTTIIYTLDSSDYLALETVSGDTLNNQFTIKYQSRYIGSAGSVVWQATGLPQFIRAGETRKMTVRYGEPSQAEINTAVTDDWITPVANIDYSMTADAEGIGIDLTQYLVMAVEWGASSANVTLTNVAQQDAYLQTVQIRATPLYSKSETVTEISEASRAAYNLRPAPDLDIRVLDNQDAARDAARYYLRIYATPTPFVRRIQVIANQSNELASVVHNASIGTHLNLRDSIGGHDQDYFIVGEQFSYTSDDRLLKVEWILKPHNREAFWLVEESGYSELSVTTILGL